MMSTSTLTEREFLTIFRAIIFDFLFNSGLLYFIKFMLYYNKKETKQYIFFSGIVSQYYCYLQLFIKHFFSVFFLYFPIPSISSTSVFLSRQFWWSNTALFLVNVDSFKLIRRLSSPFWFALQNFKNCSQESLLS